ncbi:MAG: hypothetical protein IJR50_02900 [Treponema sp.]|nr:hypothetical protein [Treponema sp.]
MNKLKKICSILITLAVSIALQAHVYNSQQLLPDGHWMYDALYMLNADVGRATLGDSAPLSVAELKMYFDDIPYNKLSESGKRLYSQVWDFFTDKKFAINFGPVKVGFNVIAEPQLMYKSNKNIDWSFGTDYTGKIAPDGKDYWASSSFLGNSASNPFLSLPLSLSFGDSIIIETTPFFGKSFQGMSKQRNFTNLPYNFNDMEFLWPRTAYASVGKSFNKWGVNLHIAHEGMRIGKTQTGSIIYNSTFETDAYVQFNVYSPYVKYNLDIVQIARNRFMYIHNLDVIPYFKWIKLRILEGTLVNAPFEFRFLNPLMIMHSFGAWNDYTTPEESKYYDEAHVCAYMGASFDITPCKYLRLYGLYAQNEIQSKHELKSAIGRAMPDSFGVQTGAEFTFPDKHNGWWLCTLEGVYTSPFFYIKHGAEWSLYSARQDMQGNSNPVCSWIGTPFGPDCIGAQLRVGYRHMQKWSCTMEYLFVAHGTNSFGLFQNTVTINGKEYYSYYPAVRRKLVGTTAALTDEEAASLARTLRLTGVVQYTNCITLKGTYMINNHFAFAARLSYMFIFNNKNKLGVFAHGVELSTSFTYTLL